MIGVATNFGAHWISSPRMPLRRAPASGSSHGRHTLSAQTSPKRPKPLPPGLEKNRPPQSPYSLLFTLRRANGGMPHLNAYQGLIHTNPTIGFLYLLCCLGMSGFPITTTFIGQDVLLSHVGEGLS